MMLILTIIGVILTALILLTQHQNKLERRHAEIVQLRVQIITAASTLRQALTSDIFHLETARLELRRLPNSKDKIEIIERLPPIIESAVALRKNVDEFTADFEKLDTRKINRSSVLLNFQDFAARLQLIEPKSRDLLDNASALLTTIRQKLDHALLGESDEAASGNSS